MHLIEARLSLGQGLKVRIADEQEENHEVALPTGITRLLVHIFAEISEGRTVKIVPENSTLTTQEAAELLNVSRPYLVSLLEEDKIKYFKVGTHRRIRFTDLMAYKEERDATGKVALDEMVEASEDLMEY